MINCIIVLNKETYFRPISNQACFFIQHSTKGWINLSAQKVIKELNREIFENTSLIFIPFILFRFMWSWWCRCSFRTFRQRCFSSSASRCSSPSIIVVAWTQGLYNTGWFKKQFSPCWLGPRQSMYSSLSLDSIEFAICLSAFSKCIEKVSLSRLFLQWGACIRMWYRAALLLDIQRALYAPLS